MDTENSHLLILRQWPGLERGGRRRLCIWRNRPSAASTPGLLSSVNRRFLYGLNQFLSWLNPLLDAKCSSFQFRVRLTHL